jgi:SAM-dependent methyltransferase
MASGKKGHVPTNLIEGSAELIPLDDSSVDTIVTVVTTWTLCTIPDVAKALAEMRRVLKQDGQLCSSSIVCRVMKARKWQNRLTPVWKRIAGGCHLNHPIADLVDAARFRVSRLETGYMPGPKPMTFKRRHTTANMIS